MYKFRDFMDDVNRAAAHAPLWAEELEKRLVITTGSLVAKKNKQNPTQPRLKLTLDDIEWVLGSGRYHQ